ncbi:MAG: 50S ribosomal protein L21 [Spirochaetaceae bacterium]|nr:MAG: 50S ribosomal protein L21 [Spirochaetaceae bacterium]
MYAMVEIAGKQYKAEPGSVLKVDRLAQDAGASLEFDSVLMLRDTETVKVGTPYVKGARVTAVVEEHGKDKKIIVFKYKRRKNYKRKRGHRQQYSVIRVGEILGA